MHTHMCETKSGPSLLGEEGFTSTDLRERQQPSPMAIKTGPLKGPLKVSVQGPLSGALEGP